ncbi:MarR family transcriptional regulator [Streptomyces sp. NPDC048278]|uniref:MarR family winged helix-turn-helix transcriptional regulator n=1 Tax=Streptomyces sp. NPDC048278 TaxID=3155809 RepID=UPI0034196177
MPEPLVEPPRTSIALMLRAVYNRLTTEIQAAVNTAGLDDFRPVHGNVIPFVPEEGITVSTLAARLDLSKQAIGQVVEELERLGYVERRPDPGDRRARLLFLTDRGRAVRPVAEAASKAVERRWAELIGPDSLESLRTTLRDLLDSLESPPSDQARR